MHSLMPKLLKDVYADIDAIFRELGTASADRSSYTPSSHISTKTQTPIPVPECTPTRAAANVLAMGGSASWRKERLCAKPVTNNNCDCGFEYLLSGKRRLESTGESDCEGPHCRIIITQQ